VAFGLFYICVFGLQKNCANSLIMCHLRHLLFHLRLDLRLRQVHRHLRFATQD